MLAVSRCALDEGFRTAALSAGVAPQLRTFSRPSSPANNTTP